MFSKFGTTRPDNGKNVVERIYRGALGSYFFCSKVNGEFRLFRTIVDQRVPGGIAGKLVEKDGGFEQNSVIIKKNGEYTNLMMSNIKVYPTFKPNAKVLAMKPTGDESFEKIFRPAKVVSEKICAGGRTFKSLGIGSSENRDTRHKYELIFKGEKEKVAVYEELIVPIEKYWGKELAVYEANYDESSSSSDSESTSSDSESSSSDSESSSSESESSSSDSKHKPKKHHGHKHKHHNKSRKHHGKQPKIIIMPVFIPFVQNQQYLGYGSYY